MKKDNCPICYSELQVINCAPCYDCGHLSTEIEHFKSGKHTYNIYNVHEGLILQLCNTCDVDFGSYKPSYFGSKFSKEISFEKFELIKPVHNPNLEKDKYCPECNRRLKFLTFLKNVRNH